MSDPLEAIESAAIDHAMHSVSPDTILRYGEPLSDEAVAIGELLAKRPPWYAMDRYSAEGWAGFAEAVLRARAALDEERRQ